MTRTPGSLVGRCAAAGALLMLALLVVKNGGEDEGSDVILALGPLAALLGGAVGAVVGVLVRSGRPRQ